MSWATSAISVRHECEVLRYLQKYNVHGVERCIASSSYVPPDGVRTDTPTGGAGERTDKRTEETTVTVGTGPSASLIEDSDFFPQKTLSASSTGFKTQGTSGINGNNGNSGNNARNSEVISGNSAAVSEQTPSDPPRVPKKATSYIVSLYEEDREENRRNNLKNEEREKEERDREEREMDSKRAMIVLEPYFQSVSPSRSTLQDIPLTDVKVKAVHNLITTMVEMLSAGAAGSDLQPLMDVNTGENQIFLQPNHR